MLAFTTVPYACWNLLTSLCMTTVEYFFFPFVALNKHRGSPDAWGLGSVDFKLRGLGLVSPWYCFIVMNTVPWTLVFENRTDSWLRNTSLSTRTISKQHWASPTPPVLSNNNRLQLISTNITSPEIVSIFYYNRQQLWFQTGVIWVYYHIRWNLKLNISDYM